MSQRSQRPESNASGAVRVGTRIAFVFTDAVSPNYLLAGQLEYLSASGATIDVYCGGSPSQLVRLADREGIGVRKIPFTRRPSPLRDLACLVRTITALAATRYDVVVCATPKAMLIGMLSAFLTRQPRRIAWFHGRAYELYSGWRRRVFVWLDRLVVATATDVLVVSPSLLKAMSAEIDFRDRRVRVPAHGSSNGVDGDRFVPLSPGQRLELRARYGLAAQDFVLVTVGRICADKGVPEALELSERLSDRSDVVWLFVGECEDPALSEAIGAHTGQRARWLGHLDRIEEIFQIADLHVFPSRREGFGNVAIEAASCGVPTFAFDRVGMRDSVIVGATGKLFAVGDDTGMEAAVRQAANAGLPLDQAWPQARKIVLERFSQSVVWPAHREIFLDAETGR